MKKTTLVLLILAAMPALANAKTYKEMFGAEPARGTPALVAALKSMDFKQGDIALPRANATLKIPEGFYYLDPADTRKVLVDLWGNPPEGSNTLGMLFPAKYAPENPDNWGAVIDYSAEGYVSDEDAASADFDAVLKDLQQQTSDNNEERKRAGYEPSRWLAGPRRRATTNQPTPCTGHEICCSAQTRPHLTH